MTETEKTALRRRIAERTDRKREARKAMSDFAKDVDQALDAKPRALNSKFASAKRKS